MYGSLQITDFCEIPILTVKLIRRVQILLSIFEKSSKRFGNVAVSKAYLNTKRLSYLKLNFADLSQ